MTPSVVVRVFFHGLLLFVPDSDETPRELEVLLLDARNPPEASDGCAIHPHEPRLIFAVGSRNDCPVEHHCTMRFGLCECPLEETRIYFHEKEPTGSPDFGCGYRGGRPGPLSGCVPRLPVNRCAIDRRLRKDLGLQHAKPGWLDWMLPDKTTAYRGDNLVVASMELKLAKALYGCETPGKHDHWRYEPLSRRKLFPVTRAPVELVVAQLQARADCSGARPTLRITLERLNQRSSFDLEVPVYECPESHDLCLDVAIANDMGSKGMHWTSGRCATGHLARDFELLNDLLIDPRDLERRLVPQVVPGSGTLDPTYGNDWRPECFSKSLQPFLDPLRKLDAPQICGGGMGG